ncbi:rRNA accumulation- protein [Aspergillus melleus]|uniref:rRNA accumulation- protein n=1 Tax=Aspergillus melleus TaxID=138277 RepID=A0ACC3AZQ4_9EURO|nr:rRNA accumulation- protein [Aspergillus melleus]
MTDQQQQQQQPTSASTYLDMGITLAVNNWPAMNLAVQSNWGGPTSADKRDWLCGAISEMLAERPETDALDLEDVLEQVMNDEFDVVVDDESAVPVAAQIIEFRDQTARGEFDVIQEMWETWQQKIAAKGGATNAVEGFKRGEDQGSDDDDDEDDEEDEDMGDAPALVSAPREKVEPEIDEDGFTKVVGKKKR